MRNLAPLKRYGQNFLVDQNISKKIVESAFIEKEDFILEIGPGKGALTKYLIKLPNNYLGIEVDRGLYAFLCKEFAKYLSLYGKKIMLSDVLETELRFIEKKVNVIANLPYNIASLIIVKLIKEDISLKSMTIMIQKEMSQRLFALPGAKEYGRLSVFIQNFFEGDILFEVKENCFYPKPKVRSIVIRLVPKSDFYEKKLHCKDFEDFLRKVFSQPRKIIKNVLNEEYIRIFSEMNENLLSMRPGQIDPEMYWRIFRLLKGRSL
ncbi:MAG: ribosomal RNA small subunit methyltransferase A [Thermodesulfobium narugense]|nr:MAG: ribosomal RNA small subunit methyltransferase A [Thermodesulfobium narugense]